jgi:catechol-2,3-dioxygenase
MTEHAAPRIVHVALFTRNPRELAPFYRDVFDMEIVHSRNAVQLWDGRTLLALNPWRGIGEEKLRIDEVGEPQAKGFDHFGFQITDVEATKNHLHKNYPACEISKRPAGRTFTEWRAHDPEGNRIDLSEMGYKPVSEDELQSMAVQTPCQIKRIVIGAENIAPLAEFYQRGFGMKVAQQTAGESLLTDGATELQLIKSDSADAGFQSLGFRLFDQDRMLALARRAGVTMSRTENRDGASAEFQLRDPDGNQLMLFRNNA